MSGSTSLYKLTKPTVSGDADVWGGFLNTDMDGIDKLIGAITTTGSANAYVLTSGQTLTAYATGQSFLIKPNFTNSGAATINVDSIGAKNIYKNVAGTPTAVASGDIPSGIPVRVTYDGTQFILHSTPSGVYQPLDATLTALAALSWSSLTPVTQFTAADTVSLTSAPKVTTLELGDATDTTLSRSEAGKLAVEGVDVILASGTQTVGGAKTFSTTMGVSSSFANFFIHDTGSGSDAKRYRWTTNNDGTLRMQTLTDDLVSVNTVYTVSRSGLAPLLFAFGVPVQARTPLSSETTGTLTVASANMEIMASGGITLPNSVFSAQDKIIIHGNGTARTITRGSGVTMYINGVDSATGTLTANGIMAVHWRTASVCVLTGNIS